MIGFKLCVSKCVQLLILWNVCDCLPMKLETAVQSIDNGKPPHDKIVTILISMACSKCKKDGDCPCLKKLGCLNDCEMSPIIMQNHLGVLGDGIALIQGKQL